VLLSGTVREQPEKGGGGERLEVEEKGIGGGGATMEGRIGREGHAPREGIGSLVARVFTLGCLFICHG
jgi:hypothetical protein